MSFELTLLAWSAMLALAHVVVQAFFYNLQITPDQNAGPRDDIPLPSGVAGRANRALRNFVETYPAFVALAATAAISGTSNTWTQGGAGLYLLMRIVYVPLYIAGVPYVRTAAWSLSGLGLGLMFVGVLI